MQQLNHTYRILSMTMALLVFFSSVGLTIDMHYCNGELKNVAFIGKANSCHELEANGNKKMCPHHQKMMGMGDHVTADQNDCCQNKTMRFQSDDDKNISLSDISISPVTLDFVFAFVMTLFNINDLQVDNSNFAIYESPSISRDIYVLYESFII